MLFPAHAGVIPRCEAAETAEKPIPRTRGGDPDLVCPGVVDGDYSPHTRG